jgi:hypothetical protein
MAKYFRCSVANAATIQCNVVGQLVHGVIVLDSSADCKRSFLMTLSSHFNHCNWKYINVTGINFCYCTFKHRLCTLNCRYIIKNSDMSSPPPGLIFTPVPFGRFSRNSVRTYAPAGHNAVVFYLLRSVTWRQHELVMRERNKRLLLSRSYSDVL